MKRRAWLIAGILLVAAAAASAVASPAPFFRSYLFSFLFWLDLPLGAVGLLLVHDLTGGRWGERSKPPLEAMAGTILLFALLAIPILLGMKELYPWLDPAVAADPKIAHKLGYLNPASFAARAIAYFLCWLGLALGRRVRGNRIAGPGLVILAVTVTFASIDWQMSLEPRWYSTMYGLVYAVGQALQAFAFTLVVFGVTAKRRLGDEQTHLDLGNILLTLVILWTYVSFMQYLIVWSGNLPEEVTWFQHRSHGGWQWLVLLLALFQFGAPFFVLLFRGAKRRPRGLLALGVLLLLARVIDHYWMLMPSFSPDSLTLPWQTLALFTGFGALWFHFFKGRLAACAKGGGK